jgi:hypothetical protein
MEMLAHAAGQRRPDETTSSSPRHAPQLGVLKDPKRGPTDVQDDPNTYRSRGIRGIPATNRTRGDLYMPSLQRSGGHGAAYAGVLSSIGGAPEDTAHGDRGENIPGGTGGSNLQGSPRILSRPRLLRASNADKIVGGEKGLEPAIRRGWINRKEVLAGEEWHNHSPLTTTSLEI